jgi:hypothetical protein
MGSRRQIFPHGARSSAVFLVLREEAAREQSSAASPIQRTKRTEYSK